MDELQQRISIKKSEKEIEAYVNTSVEVFSGDEVEIEAECDEYLLGEIIEKFGKNVDIRPINEIMVKMKLKANPLGFKLWAMRNLDMVIIKKPQSLVNEMKEIIEEASKKYKK